jgi:hypothetical protein
MAKTSTVTHRTALDNVLPPAPAASEVWWLRELTAQIICLRAELSGHSAVALAQEVFPSMPRGSITEQEPHAELLRDLMGRR